MPISQGSLPICEYASQFETFLGRLDSYDESMMLNQFVWGLQPELGCFVSLHYLKSIVQVVSLAKITKLVVKSSKCPIGKNVAEGTQLRGPNQANWGQGRWINSMSRGRGRSGGGRGGSWSRGRSVGGKEDVVPMDLIP